MAIGGYRVIDLGGIDVTNTSVVAEGIYNDIEKSLGKPILLRNYSISGVESQAAFVFPYSESAGGGITRYVIPYRFTDTGFDALSINDKDELVKTNKRFS